MARYGSVAVCHDQIANVHFWPKAASVNSRNPGCAGFPGRIGRRASESLQLTDCSADNLERYSVVLQGKLLRGSGFCRLLGITEDRLRKRVKSGRIFSVEFEAEPHYPAFLLSDLLDHKDFARVVQRLGDSTGWSKWKFFTTPAESLGGLTPLWALARKQVTRVLKEAENFAQR